MIIWFTTNTLYGAAHHSLAVRVILFQVTLYAPYTGGGLFNHPVRSQGETQQNAGADAIRRQAESRDEPVDSER